MKNCFWCGRPVAGVDKKAITVLCSGCVLDPLAYLAFHESNGKKPKEQESPHEPIIIIEGG